MGNLKLFDEFESEYTAINNRVYFKRDEKYCHIRISHHPWFKYELDDYLMERYVIVSLYLNDICTQIELADAFNLHRNSVGKWKRNYEKSGLLGLIKQKTAPKSRTKINLEIRDFILSFDYKHPDITYNYVVEKVKEKYEVELHPSTVGDLVRGRTHQESLSLFDGIEEEKKEKASLESQAEQDKTSLEGETEAAYETTEHNLKDSRQRIKARLKDGLISCYGAAFIFLHFIKELGLVDIFTETVRENLDSDELKEHFYGLEEFIKTLIFLIIFRFPSFEQFKKVSALEFGPLIGYDRTPCVHTLRDRLDEIANFEACNELMERLAKEYLKHGLIDIGVLYLDGHPVPYYGRNVTPKKFFSTRNLALKADQHIFVNGKNGRPFIFKLTDASKKFAEIIPEIADDAKALIQEETERDAPLVLVFDREPYSAKLFKKLDEKGYIFISWRKWDKKVSLANFTEKVHWENNNTTLTYRIYRREITVGRKRHPVEAISFYCEDDFDPEKDSPATLVTNAGKFNPEDYQDFTGLSSLKLIQLISGRWKQENFFKTMKNHYFMDHHPDYQFEEFSPQPVVKNPAVKELEKEIKALKKDRSSIINKLGKKFSDSRYNDKSLQHYQSLKTNRNWLEEKEEIDAKIKKFKAKKENLPAAVPFDSLSRGKMKHRTITRKLFLDILKTAVYNMQEMALDSFAKYYDNPDDIRVIMEMLINSTSHLQLKDGVLIVSVQQPDRPKYRRSIEGFFKELNSLDIKDDNSLADKIRFQLTDVVSR